MKFQLKDIVFYLKYNKIHSGKVVGRLFSEHVEASSNIYVDETRTKDFPFMEKYLVLDNENQTDWTLGAFELFRSKEELIEYIQN